jgi:hypothetical protein
MRFEFDHAPKKAVDPEREENGNWGNRFLYNAAAFLSGFRREPHIHTIHGTLMRMLAMTTRW